MMNCDTLESFYSLPYCGDEGFLSNLLADHHPNHLHPEDARFIAELVKATGISVPSPWAKLDLQQLLESEA